MAQYDAEFNGQSVGEDDEEEGEGGEDFPCPAPWFTQTLEEWSLVEKTGCNVLQIQEEMNIDTRFRHLAAISVMEKARPELERQARERAKNNSES